MQSNRGLLDRRMQGRVKSTQRKELTRFCSEAEGSSGRFHWHILKDG